MQEVRMGDRLELECEAFGGPFPAIQWLRDGQPIGQGVVSLIRQRITFIPLTAWMTVNDGRKTFVTVPKIKKWQILTICIKVTDFFGK